MKEFSEKTVLITGAAQGVGKETSYLFAEEGATVLMADINMRALEILQEDFVRRKLNVHIIHCDISDIKSIQHMLDAIILKYRKIDILVNNAGVSMTGKIMDIKEEDWDKVLGVNVKGTFFVLLSTVKTMIQNEISGSIVNIASIAGEKGRPNFLTYGASKAAVINLTRSAALEFAKHGIRINAVSPGTIATPMWAEIAEKVSEIDNIPIGEMQKKWVERIPLKRLASPTDIANTIIFLCSDKASYITGQVINVCGGLSIT